MANNRVIQNSLIKMIYNKTKLNVGVELSNFVKFDFEITLLNNHKNNNKAFKAQDIHKFDAIKLCKILVKMECFVIYKTFGNKTIFYVRSK